MSTYLSVAAEWTAIVRKRRYLVSSLDEILPILEQMKRERFMGVVKFDVGCGGTVTSVEVEERSKINPLDNAV
jgi:hypothetical protein